MKSCSSLLLTVLVLAALVAGGWFIYNKAQETTTHTVATTAGGRPKLTARNGTHYVLTISMTGPQTMRLQIAPGHSETKTLLAGTYEVEGSLSDPKTTPFKGSWELKEGGTYDVPFQRSEGSGGQSAVLISGQAAATQNKP